ncbi:MAG: hypothetical protein JO264_21430, partial [Acidisphaera sp.]|nr:hypothetical protein [Acidisphaera sp.]
MPDGVLGLLLVALLCVGVMWTVIFLCRLAYAPIYAVKRSNALVRDKDAEIQRLTIEADDRVNRPNDMHHALSIEFEQAEPCLRRSGLPAGNARYEVYVRIKNTGNGFLSECVVSILNIKPEPDNRRGYTILTPISSLAKGEHRYVLVGGFNEKPSESGQAIYNELVTFAFATGGLFGGYTTLSPPSQDNPAVLLIEAKALECAAEQREFKL